MPDTRIDPTTGESPARRQFLSDIITTAIFGGIGYWSECSDYTWSDEHPETTGAMIHEIDDNGVYHDEALVIDSEVIRVGICRLLDGTVSYPPRATANLLAAASELDAGEIDADDADCIVQAGLFGELRYG